MGSELTDDWEEDLDPNQARPLVVAPNRKINPQYVGLYRYKVLAVVIMAGHPTE